MKFIRQNDNKELENEIAKIISNIWLSSLVPVIGFLLSTVSLKLVRNVWEKNKK